jgi:hypothetical protein
MACSTPASRTTCFPGFAVARVKYKPYFKKTPKKAEPSSEGAPVEGEEPAKPAEQFTEELIYQEVATEYVGWDFFCMSRSRNYDRVWYVAFGDDLTKDEVRAQFGEDIAAELPYGRKEEGETDEREPTTRVWEVWCKRGRGRFVVAEGHDGWLKAPEKDPLRLEQFFPNAKPIWAIASNDKLLPVPEYCEYQDQAIELDDLTERIDVLTSALRRRGVYDQQFSTLAQMLTGKTDNNFVAVENWAAFVEKGGIQNLALEMPLEGLVAAIIQLEERREKVKQTIYEVTGIADIVRGASNPTETATAQQIKGRWAGLRIATRQKKFANFARDLVRLKAEIIAERFDPQTLALMTGVQLPYQADKLQYQQTQAMAQQQAQQAQQMGQQVQPPQANLEEEKFYAQPTWEEVCAVLQNDKLRGFKIDIETDSTVQPDADAEKAARTELLTALGDFSQRVIPGVQAGIVPRALAVQAIQFALRAFKVGSQMEQELEEMDQDTGPTPQQQQKEQELQQREQAVAQVETQAKDQQHQAQLASKDAARAGDQVKHDREIFALTKKFTEDVQNIRDDFERLAEQLMGHSEKAVREAISSTNPQGPVQ